MQWLEIVRVFGSWDAATEDRLRDSLQVELDKLKTDPRCRAAAAFRHAAFTGDFAVIVVWDAPECPRRSKEVGTLAEYLASFGMADHMLLIGFAGWFGGQE